MNARNSLVRLGVASAVAFTPVVAMAQAAPSAAAAGFSDGTDALLADMALYAPALLACVAVAVAVRIGISWLRRVG